MGKATPASLVHKTFLPAQVPQIDGSWTWLRKCNGAFHRDQRKKASELLCTVFEQGGYSCKHSGEIQHVSFKSIKNMLSTTRLVLNSGLLKLPQGQHRGLEFEHADCPIGKAIELSKSGFKVATTSAASAYHVGGGFTSGGRHALEEAFCSQTTLYASLKSLAHSSSNRMHIPHDGVILSPQVEIFREGTEKGYSLLPAPVEVTAVISIAMYNCNPQVRDSPVDAPFDDDAYLKGVRTKLTVLVHAAVMSGADALILPDVGCGVFKNDPRIVGRIAGEVLYGYMSHFKKICFTGSDEFYTAAASGLTGWKHAHRGPSRL